jgi:Pin2-interacting protein X1
VSDEAAEGKEKKRKMSKEEKKAAKKAAKKAKKDEVVVARSVVSHAGRYHKRESQKMVSNYSATDLGAILGGAFVALPEVRADNGASAGTSESESESAEKVTEVKVEKIVEIERPKWVFEPPPESWWGWRVGFRPEGHGDGVKGDVESLERKRGFDEDDQVNLFESTTAGANKNRRGLGSGQGRDAAADYSGTKKSFGAEDEVSEAEREAATSAKKVNWQKIGEKILSKTDGAMRTKKFMEKVLKKSECGDDEAIRTIYQDAAFHILSRSGVFTSLEEDVVKLIK